MPRKREWKMEDRGWRDRLFAIFHPPSSILVFLPRRTWRSWRSWRSNRIEAFSFLLRDHHRPGTAAFEVQFVVFHQPDHLRAAQQHRPVAVHVVGGGAVIVIDVVVGVARADADIRQFSVAGDL